jgi:hypothetical protein
MNPSSKGLCPFRFAGFTAVAWRTQTLPRTGRGWRQGLIHSPLVGRMDQGLFLRPPRPSLKSLIGQSLPGGRLPPNRRYLQNRRPHQNRRHIQGRRPHLGRRPFLARQARRRVQHPRPAGPGRCRFGRLSLRRHHRQRHRQPRRHSRSQNRPPSWPPW